ncbi:primosome assembly protein PriA [Beutenbergia cavernae DSM 12333]|uniref:Probable replication restart protein PriA n=1 Tax=Beutenbergia cavernae (strain ATCC BAA-8 / DSM 12333 / CCUG 43141 / JCM 11478 / NBRC 16432 / NCIMB 13614 / HKI 0122) TaxID=471853 RepID=C5C695_BEUC1|nr:primosome assembly protein PriA [Beutenbergia cavernae]ACQ80301.1 primosome assembly protein PriA [Beutenbergia cavernae DSM 12333]
MTDERVVAVVVDVPLPHLDRPFDYTVPAELADDVAPGVRVKVPFAGRERDAWVVADGSAAAEAGGDGAGNGRRLAPIRRVTSAVPVLTPAVLALARDVADRYAGTLTDVLRFAVPSRHARTEQSVLGGTAVPDAAAGAPRATDDDVEAWAGTVGGRALLRRLGAGEAPRAAWSVPGGPDRARAGIAAAVAATRASGRGAIVVAGDAREAGRLADALEARLAEPVARLLASTGPAARYRAYLRVLLGECRVVVGTRSAAWAPVADLGLLAVWDDGDDLLIEQRAPYPHAAEVLAMRADAESAGMLIASFGRSTWAQHRLSTGWAVELRADRATVRRRVPRVEAPGEADLAREGPGALARIPTPAWRLVRETLDAGPVLVQVPRAGYVPALVCATCRAAARCQACAGPLRLVRSGPPSCGVCGRVQADWRCPACSQTRLRAVRIGSDRTAEELGRAFPQVPVVVSGQAAGVTDAVDAKPRLVIATPGAEPEAEHGYAGALLLDAAATTALPALDAGEEALRRWFAAAALVRSADDGGRVMLLGGPPAALAQTLVRWDPATFAERELEERRELAFPPAARLVAISGPAPAVADVLREAHLPPSADVLGPVPTGGDDDEVRALARAPLEDGLALTRAVRAALGVRSAHKRAGAVRVQADPRWLV